MTSPLGSGVFAAGDNNEGQLWSTRFQLSPNFVPCDKFPCEAGEISAISGWGNSLAVLVGKDKVVLRSDGEINTLDVEKIKDIACTGESVVGLRKGGEVVDLLTNETYGEKGYTSIAASSCIVCGIDKKSRAVRWQDGERSVLVDDAIAVGCTDSVVYVSTEEGVWAFEGEDETEMPCKDKIVMIRGSDETVLFLGETGAVYTCEFGGLSRVFGIPTMVSIAAGPQHFAAISEDGNLFTWGFNPSGQLGFGTDRPTTQPTQVLDHVTMVVCGTHHTLAVRNVGASPKPPPEFDMSVIKARVESSGNLKNTRPLTRAERLW